MQIARLVFSQPTMRVCCWNAVVVISSMIVVSGQWSVVSGQWKYEDRGRLTTDNGLLTSKEYNSS